MRKSIIMDDYPDDVKRRFKTYKNNIILDKFKDVSTYVDDAYNKIGLDRFIHYGLLKEEIVDKIKKSIKNYPKNGWKFNRLQYDLVIKEDSFLHLTDNKSKITKHDVKNFAIKLPNIVANFDSVIYSNNGIDEGLRFKKKFKDGTYISFLLTSDKKSRLLAKSISMDKHTYTNKKRSVSLSANDKPLAKTSKTDRVFASSTCNVSHKD